MRDEEHIERLLAQTPVPCLREGPHREQLKAKLLQSDHSAARKEVKPIGIGRPFRPTRLAKLAAGVLITVALLATGWTAETVYRTITEKSVELERISLPPVTLPDGSMLGGAFGIGTYIPADAPPGTTEAARRHHEEMKQLISQKKYEFVRTIELPSELKQYVYRFVFADGEQGTRRFFMPLDSVASWDDCVQKMKEQATQRQEAFVKALAAGKFRLLNLETELTHVCRDADSNQKLSVLRVDHSDGEDDALVFLGELDQPHYSTSWKDHLEAIRRGNRVLLDLSTSTSMTYEITLDDGSTTTFEVTGPELMKEPEG